MKLFPSGDTATVRDVDEKELDASGKIQLQPRLRRGVRRCVRRAPRAPACHRGQDAGERRHGPRDVPQGRASGDRFGPVQTGRTAFHLLELDACVARMTETHRQLLGQTTPQQPAHRLRRFRWQCGPFRLAREHRCDRVGHGVRRRERAPAGEHLEDDTAQRPDVGAPVHALATRLLGAHVGGAAENDARLRRRRRRHGRRHRERCRGSVRSSHIAWFSQLGETEVQHLHTAIGAELDVGRLQVPVNDAAVVGGFKRLRNLARDRQRLVKGHRSLLDAIRERGAFDELHDERPGRTSLLEAVDLGDVRMVERCEQLGLALEPRQPLRIAGESIEQDFDCHLAIQAGVARAVDLAHPAGAERRHDLERTKAGAGCETHYYFDRAAVICAVRQSFSLRRRPTGYANTLPTVLLRTYDPAPGDAILAQPPLRTSRPARRLRKLRDRRRALLQALDRFRSGVCGRLVGVPGRTWRLDGSLRP